MLRSLLLGSSTIMPLRAPEGVGGGGGDDEVDTVDNRHTDVILREVAEKAFDEAASAADDAAGAGKAAPGDDAAATAGKTAKTDQGDDADAVGDRGDGRTKSGQFAKKPAAADPKAAAQPAKLPAKAEGQGQDDAAAAAAAAGDNAGASAAGASAQKAAPPPGFSVKSKADWEKVAQQFPHLVADIAKREDEISRGFAEYADLKPFAARAKQSGQTLAQAMTAYTGIEDLIRRDLGGGLMHIVQNAGQTQAEAANLFAHLAQRLGHQGFKAPGDQNPGGSPQDQPGGADPASIIEQIVTRAVAPLADRVQKFETAHTSQAEAARSQRLTTAQQVVDTFKADPAHKFYANVEERIETLLANGVVKRSGDLAADLATAYDMACNMDPEIREALINERIATEREAARKAEIEEANRAKAASRSITGAPAPGASVPRGRKAPGVDPLRAAAEAAYDAAAGSV